MRISDWSSDVCSSDLGSARWAERRSEAAGAAPAYIYRFDFATPVLDGAIGAAHGGDIPFAMANYTASSMAGDRPENPAMAKIMSETWSILPQPATRTIPPYLNGSPMSPRSGQRSFSMCRRMVKTILAPRFAHS